MLSRLDAQTTAMAYVSTREIVDRSLANLGPGLTDRVRLKIGALRDCRGHAGLLQQAWTNLLSNSLKFTRERNPALIEIGSLETDRGVTYFVRDNGAGFDPARAHGLFQPFRRLHDARRYEGHGIGLAIVHRIVRRHGGRVWAEAAPERGATFFFTLGAQQVD